MISLRILIEPVLLLTSLTITNGVLFANIVFNFLLQYLIDYEFNLDIAFFVLCIVFILIFEIFSEELQMYNVIISSSMIGSLIIFRVI